jgi:cyanophycinase
MNMSRFRIWIGCLFTVFCWQSVSVLLAGPPDRENPFGLPVAEDEARQPGCVMLHGGGRGLRDEIRQEFVRLAGGKRACIVLVPSDMSQRGRNSNGERLAQAESVAAYERRLATPAEYGRWAALASDGQVAEFHFAYLDWEHDPGDKKFFEQLENATGVWLPAHDQDWLPKLLAAEYPQKLSRFQLALRKVIARGGVVGGLGGGAACLPETIIESNLTSEDGGWIKAKLGFGLALCDGVVVDQNFSSWAGRLERMTDLLRNGQRLDRIEALPGVGRRTIGLGVERHTVIVLQGNTIRALGEGRGHVFLKSNGDRTITWRTIEAGDEPLVVRSSAARGKSDDKDTPAEPEDPRFFNPFGLPDVGGEVARGTVVLHGGGSTGEMFELLPKLAGTPKPRLIHCPAARESGRPTVGGDATAFRNQLEEIFAPWRELETHGQIDDLTFVTTSDAADANRADFVKPIGQANAMWFCGGDQAWLARLFVDRNEPTRFQREVIDIVRRGGVVGGSSAGLAVMPDIMIEGGAAENRQPARAELSRGIGVLKHVLAEQHFDARSGRIERLTGLLRDHKRLANFSPTCRPKQMIALAVEEDTALLVQARRLRVMGKKLAHVFLQSADARIVTWHALKPGDAAARARRECA